MMALLPQQKKTETQGTQGSPLKKTCNEDRSENPEYLPEFLPKVVVGDLQWNKTKLRDVSSNLWVSSQSFAGENNVFFLSPLPILLFQIMPFLRAEYNFKDLIIVLTPLTNGPHQKTLL